MKGTLYNHRAIRSRGIPMPDSHGRTPEEFSEDRERRIGELANHYERYLSDLGTKNRFANAIPVNVNGVDYESAMEASHALGVSDQVIREACRRSDHRIVFRPDGGQVVTIVAYFKRKMK